jgi:hypothetical protein
MYTINVSTVEIHYWVTGRTYPVSQTQGLFDFAQSSEEIAEQIAGDRRRIDRLLGFCHSQAW